MSAEPKTYRRLPGRDRSWRTLVANARARLYEGADHLLLTQTVAYSESCKRFYYKDIQAFDIRRTGIGKAFNIVWGVITILVVALTIALARSFPESTVYVAPFILLPLAGLLYNLWLGPTCKTRVYTAVQVEELPSLARLHTARRVVERLTPAIEAVQGRVPQEDLEALSGEVLAVGSTVSPLFDIQRLVPKPPDNGNRHAVFFGLAVLDAAISLLMLIDINAITQLINSVSTTALLVALIIALTRHKTHDVPAALRRYAWAGCVAIAVSTPVSAIYGMVVAIKYQLDHPGNIGGLEDILRPDEPIFIGIVFFSVIVLSVIGSLGLYHWQRLRKPAVPPPPPAENMQP